MSEYVLTPAERALFEALDTLGVPYLIVGMGAALLEGATGTTQDLDVWLGAMDTEKVKQAARAAGGFYTAGMGLQPPAIGGDGLDRIDLVMTAQGLEPFEIEYARSKHHDLDGVPVRVLPLERVILSKRTSNRPKDQAQLPILEATLAARARRK